MAPRTQASVLRVLADVEASREEPEKLEINLIKLAAICAEPESQEDLFKRDVIGVLTSILQDRGITDKTHESVLNCLLFFACEELYKHRLVVVHNALRIVLDDLEGMQPVGESSRGLFQEVEARSVAVRPEDPEFVAIGDDIAMNCSPYNEFECKIVATQLAILRHLCEGDMELESLFFLGAVHVLLDVLYRSEDNHAIQRALHTLLVEFTRLPGVAIQMSRQPTIINRLVVAFQVAVDGELMRMWTFLFWRMSLNGDAHFGMCKSGLLAVSTSKLWHSLLSGEKDVAKVLPESLATLALMYLNLTATEVGVKRLWKPDVLSVVVDIMERTQNPVVQLTLIQVTTTLALTFAATDSEAVALLEAYEEARERGLLDGRRGGRPPSATSGGPPVAMSDVALRSRRSSAAGGVGVGVDVEGEDGRPGSSPSVASERAFGGTALEGPIDPVSAVPALDLDSERSGGAEGVAGAGGGGGRASAVDGRGGGGGGGDVGGGVDSKEPTARSNNLTDRESRALLATLRSAATTDRGSGPSHIASTGVTARTDLLGGLTLGSMTSVPDSAAGSAAGLGLPASTPRGLDTSKPAAFARHILLSRFTSFLLSLLVPTTNDTVLVEVLRVLSMSKIGLDQVPLVVKYCLRRLHEPQLNPEIAELVFRMLFKCTAEYPECLVDAVVPGYVAVLGARTACSAVVVECAATLAAVTSREATSGGLCRRQAVESGLISVLAAAFEDFDPVVQGVHNFDQPLTLELLAARQSLLSVFINLMSSGTSYVEALEEANLLPALITSLQAIRGLIDSYTDRLPRICGSLLVLERQTYVIWSGMCSHMADYVFFSLSDTTTALASLSCIVSGLEIADNPEYLVHVTNILNLVTADPSTHVALASIAKDGTGPEGWIYTASLSALHVLLDGHIDGGRDAEYRSDFDVQAYKTAMVATRDLCHALYDLMLDFDVSGSFFDNPGFTAVCSILELLRDKVKILHSFERADTSYVLSIAALFWVLAPLPRHCRVLALHGGVDGLATLFDRSVMSRELIVALVGTLWLASRDHMCAEAILESDKVLEALVATAKTSQDTVTLVILGICYNLIETYRRTHGEAAAADGAVLRGKLSEMRKLVPWMLDRVANRIVVDTTAASRVNVADDHTITRIVQKSILSLIHTLQPVDQRSVERALKDVVEGRRQFAAGLISDATFQAQRNPATAPPAGKYMLTLIDDAFEELQKGDEPEWVVSYGRIPSPQKGSTLKPSLH